MSFVFERTDRFKILRNKGQFEIVLNIYREKNINAYIFFNELLLYF